MKNIQRSETDDSPLQRIVQDHMRECGSKLTTNHIVLVLQEAIVRGIFGPGRALRQDELALLLGVSKIPVREALRTLEARGFVALPQNRGAVVRELSLTQLREAFDLRQMLEPQLIRAAVSRLTDAELLAAAELVQRMEYERNAWAFSKLNARFHETLYEAADKPLSMEILRMLQGHIQRMSFMQLSLAGANRSANHDHRDILEACRNRSVDTAEQLVAKHVAAVRRTVLQLYAEHYAGCSPEQRS